VGRHGITTRIGRYLASLLWPASTASSYFQPLDASRARSVHPNGCVQETVEVQTRVGTLKVAQGRWRGVRSTRRSEEEALRLDLGQLPLATCWLRGSIPLACLMELIWSSCRHTVTRPCRASGPSSFRLVRPRRHRSLGSLGIGLTQT
jgi:hypothetical protein